MKSMSVTLEVSQLRGWLKAVACCRASQAGHTVRGGLRGRRGLYAAGRGEGCDSRDQGRSARGGKRTLNIAYMCVTREVSQRSGWLKAYARCRGSQAGNTVRGGLCT